VAAGLTERALPLAVSRDFESANAGVFAGTK
jgi:hypothetical protein